MIKERIILGIDPGTNIMGYGLISIKGKTMSLIVMGILDLRKQTDHFTKLQQIFQKTTHLIDQYHPDELAIEAPFFGKNVQSMLKLGRAQGVAISAALARSLPVFEYAPRKIKMSITGNGNAAKEQVAGILQNILDMKGMTIQMDATDGVAAAVCHYFQTNKPVSEKSYNSWKDFISKNQGRVSGK
ncbi:MAG: crossover junction endodeoxyribonuclease RuvC [Bacteroidales bacterium]|nr:crossover junction endodeoxyribonuclease RuvC [Bacteroidales bacterium]